MTNSNLLRELSDNWLLVSMFAFFVSAIIWAFRPGSRAVHRDTASIPFRNDDYPARDAAGGAAKDKELHP